METTKKNIPALRFPEFSEEWQRLKLGHFFKIFNGFAFSSLDSVKVGVRWVKIADVGIQSMKEDALSFLPYSYLETYKKFVLKKGDYVIALTRPILNGELKISRINEAFHNSLLNQRVGKLISDNHLPFIYSYLQKKELIKSIENNIAGSDPPNLSPNEIHNILVCIPKLKEQIIIATFLSAIDDKINQLKKKKELLEQYKKGVMQQIFTQQIRFKDEEGKDYPEWEEKRIDDIAISLDNKRVPLNSEQRGKMKGAIPYWGANNVMDYVNDFIFDETIILLAEDGGYFEEYKTRPIANISFGKCWVNNHAHVLKAKQGYNPVYIYYSLVHKDILAYVNVGTRSKLNKSDMLKIKLLLPSLQEQENIANYFHSLDSKIDLIEMKIEHTKSFKKGLLQQMFV